ncbi:MAG: endonuclease/exonuclease/phosphatase family protein [Bacteroidaceae bacterium]|nr:endonuclease/exonuclease/phosphatase family protein [Bacteroidaceae bacterium]
MRKQLFCLLLLATAINVVAQNRQLALYSIGFYNLENLFDTQHDEDKNDYEYLPDGANHWTEMKYEHKLHNMSRVLSEMGTDMLPDIGCSIIGVSEVENAHCLTDLCAQEPLAARNIQFCHIEGPDKRGVDCALLYNPRFFQPAKVWLQPYEMKEGVNDRPTRGFLTVQGVLAGDSITVIVCHWPSRFGGPPLRIWAGEQVRAEKDSILASNPSMKVLVMGDMNDDPMDESMRGGLKARRKQQDVKPDEMFNPWWQILLDGHGTLSYRGRWNLFDQIVMTPNCLDLAGTKAYNTLTFYKAEIFRRDYLFQQEGRYKNTPKRTHAAGVWLDGYSDHLPVVTYFVRKLN